jgi:hypothetical protein
VDKTSSSRTRDATTAAIMGADLPDFELTGRLREVGSLDGIPLLDHVVDHPRRRRSVAALRRRDG